MHDKRQEFDLSEIDLKNCGISEIGYIRKMTSEEVIRKFPGAANIPRGLNLWALFAADGSPLAVSDMADGVRSTALDRDLYTVSIH